MRNSQNYLNFSTFFQQLDLLSSDFFSSLTIPTSGGDLQEINPSMDTWSLSPLSTWSWTAQFRTWPLEIASTCQENKSKCACKSWYPRSLQLPWRSAGAPASNVFGPAARKLLCLSTSLPNHCGRSNKGAHPQTLKMKEAQRIWPTERSGLRNVITKLLEHFPRTRLGIEQSRDSAPSSCLTSRIEETLPQGEIKKTDKMVIWKHHDIVKWSVKPAQRH